SAPTVWTTASPSDADATLTIGGEPVDRALWFRGFSSAPERVPGADLAYAGGRNVYRNPHARPRAWFADRVTTSPPAQHLSEMTTPSFAPAEMALLTTPPAVAVGRPARVTSIEIGDDVRRVGVDASEGGVL